MDVFGRRSIVLPTTSACVDSGAIATLEKDKCLGRKHQVNNYYLRYLGFKMPVEPSGGMSHRQLGVWVLS